MRIGLDARLYGPRYRGLGRYVQEVFDRIVREDDKNDYVVFLRKENFADFHPANPRIKKVLTDFREYSWQEQIIFPYLLYREKLDLVHFPHYNLPILYWKKFIVTVHDLVIDALPALSRQASNLSWFKYKIKICFYKILMQFIIKKAKFIISLSNYGRQELIKLYKANQDKIVVIYNGVDVSFGEKCHWENIQYDKETFLRYNIEGEYLLYVGSVYPHKNIENFLRAFLVIRKEMEVSFVVVSKEDLFLKKLKIWAKDRGLDNGVVWLNHFLDDRELRCLYRGAKLFVWPSFYEGFGLPPLEALSCGVPVASSRAACLPEILNGAAGYFDPNDVRDIAQTTMAILTDNSLRETIVLNSVRLIRKYNWDINISSVLKIYASFEKDNE